MVLLDEVVEILVRANLHIPPARVLTSQKPQGATTRHMLESGTNRGLGCTRVVC
jgi:hypothetical protein